jgi:probable selenium-dependent hydroxylase accessory protein YqeC
MTEQWVHRPELFAQVTGIVYGNPITEVGLYAVLTSKNGIFKGAPESALRLAFLNQADLPGAHLSGQRVLELLTQRKPSGLKRVVMGCARGEPAVVEWVDLNI